MRPADASLADRDPALPGLATLLDEQALTRWLGEHGHTGRRRYLRYKPGTSCVLGLQLDGGSGPVPGVLSAFSPAAAPKLAKTRDRAPRGSVLAADAAAGLLLTTAAADRDLPAVAALSGTAELLARLLPGDVAPGTAVTVVPLRYKPARRWVGRVELPGREPLLLRAMRPAVAAQVATAVRALGAPRPRTPRLLAVDEELGVLVMEHLPGRALADLPDAERAAWSRAAGTALAQLHQHPAPALRRRDTDAAATAVHEGAALVARLLPDQVGRVHALADRVVAGLGAEGGLRVCHGDFSLDQVVAGPAGLGIADLDEVVLDDPVVDLAGVLAAEELAGGPRPEPLLAGYATIRALPAPDLLAAHTAAAMLRRAPEPFRLADPHWDRALLRVLDAAEAALP